MESSDHSCLAIGLSNLSARDVLFVEPSDSREAKEGYDCADEAEQDDVAEVVEELFTLHIEATCKHDRR